MLKQADVVLAAKLASCPGRRNQGSWRRVDRMQLQTREHNHLDRLSQRLTVSSESPPGTTSCSLLVFVFKCDVFLYYTCNLDYCVPNGVPLLAIFATSSEHTTLLLE